jgi:hypothetical protein
MAIIPNPWIPQSEAAALDPAAALIPPPSAAAGPIPEPSTAMEVPQVASAEPVPNCTVADATDDIAELLRCAFMPADPDYSRRFPRGFDPHIYMDTLEAIVEAIDPIPEFLRRRA